MVWIVVGVAVVVLVAAGLGAWLLAPSLRSLRHPGFEPSSADDASAFRAEQSGTTGGGGGMGGI